MKDWRVICYNLIQVEAGYVNNPLDRGGPTKYGITEAVARANGYTSRMEDMPVEVAQRIYEKRYWRDPGFDKVHDLNPYIAAEMCDTGVNMGPKWPTMFLQRALNVLNRGGRDFPDIDKDGVIGPATLRALGAFLNKRGFEGVTVLINLLNAQQAVRYMELAESDPSQEEFEFGWQSKRVEGIGWSPN